MSDRTIEAGDNSTIWNQKQTVKIFEKHGMENQAPSTVYNQAVREMDMFRRLRDQVEADARKQLGKLQDELEDWDIELTFQISS